MTGANSINKIIEIGKKEEREWSRWLIYVVTRKGTQNAPSSTNIRIALAQLIIASL